jgi:hypothetical protein
MKKPVTDAKGASVTGRPEHCLYVLKLARDRERAGSREAGRGWEEEG